MVSLSVLPASYRGCTVSMHTRQPWLHHMHPVRSAQQAGCRFDGLALQGLQGQRQAGVPPQCR